AGQTTKDSDPNPSPMKTLVKLLNAHVLPVLAILLLAGCRSLPPANVESFSSGVAAARNQTTLAFQAVTDFTSDSIVSYAAAQATLTDSNFVPVLPPESIAIWDTTFVGLQKYSQSLVLLTSPNLTKDYEDSIVSLATQVKHTGDDLKTQGLTSTEPS